MARRNDAKVAVPSGAVTVTPEARDAALGILHHQAKFAGAAIVTFTRLSCQLETDPEAAIRFIVGEAGKVKRPNLPVAVVVDELLPVLAPEAVSSARERHVHKATKRQREDAERKGFERGQREARKAAARETLSMINALCEARNRGLFDHAAGSLRKAYAAMCDVQDGGEAVPANPTPETDNVITVPFGRPR